MKPFLVALFCGVAWTAGPVTAEGEKEAEAPQAVSSPAPKPEPYGSTPEPELPESKQTATVPVFVPPATDRPIVRLRSASARGNDGPRPIVSVLAPERVGWTISEQPELYWHLDRIPSRPATAVFALTTDGRDEPVAEYSLPAPVRPGIQSVRLDRLGVKLEPGVEYEWSVALVANPEDWSQSIFAIAGIHRIEAPETLAPRLGRGEGEERPKILAEYGLWYDAFSALNPAEGADANTASRQALLQQVGLADLSPMP